MINPKDMSLTDIKEQYGCDFRDIDFTGVKASHFEHYRIDLTDCILPHDSDFFKKLYITEDITLVLPVADYSVYDFCGCVFCNFIFPKDAAPPTDKSLFQKVNQKNISNTSLPKGDYSKFDFNGVNISNVTFTSDSIPPSDSDFLLNSLRAQNSYLILPSSDYSAYNFCGVSLEGIKFFDGTIIPNNPKLFQKVVHKSIRNTRLAAQDYSEFDFRSVAIDARTTIAFAAKLPLNASLFKEMSLPRYGLSHTKTIPIEIITKSVIENFHLYDLENTQFHFSIFDEINKAQKSILYAKYRNSSSFQDMIEKYRQYINKYKF